MDWFAGDPLWGSAALEDEWRAASLARQAVGDAAYAAAHAAGASRAWRALEEKADTKQEHNALSQVTRDILQRCREELSLGRSSGA